MYDFERGVWAYNLVGLRVLTGRALSSETWAISTHFPPEIFGLDGQVALFRHLILAQSW